MGFGDFFKGLGNGVVDHVKKNMAELEKYSAQADALSDQALLREIKYASGNKKNAYINAAKRRGLI